MKTNSGELTQHPNSILNPDIVADWVREMRDLAARRGFKMTLAEFRGRAERGKALLPNVDRYFGHELPRAIKAVELWEMYASKFASDFAGSV